MPVRSLRVLVAFTLVLFGFAAVGVGVAAGETTGTAENYIVLYKSQAVPADAARTVERAGGTLIANYSAIGVLVARSSNSAFRSNLMKDSRIEGAAATTKFATKVEDVNAGDQGADAASGGPPAELANAPATDGDETLFPLQWDMRQIKTPEAHAITGGSPEVVVGDIDTGLDFSHPDLAPNYDAANSADCIGGTPKPLEPGNDVNGHGTHTAGTIAAADNEFGIIGVAPNVRIAGIKAGNDDGFFFPEAVVCAFIWAGSRHIDVTNNSYFADPFEYNCRNDPVQRAIWKAEQRAILYAESQGVTVVAAAGNDSDDLAHPTQDVTSPDFPEGTAEERAITNACVVIPVEIPGVVGVSADGANPQSDNNDDPTDYLKSYYSSFGVGAIEVVAPGGDRRFGVNPAKGAVNGRVLSTWPANVDCAVPEDPSAPNEPTASYCYAQGTSMASPHVAGVAALIVSRFGDLDNPQNGKMRPNQVAAYIQQTADPQPCPSELPGPTPFSGGRAYEEFLGVNSGLPQECQGGESYNSWYGNGQADAFNAVTKTSTNQTTAGA